MALATLAVAADLSARGVDTSNADRVAVALEVASAAVRDAAGAVISQTTSTLTFHGHHETLLALPGPITDVAAVTIDGTAVTEYEIEHDGLYLASSWGSGDISVTFTHGLPTVPADIVDLTCQLAIAWLGHTAQGGGSTAGLTSVRIDDAAESYNDESAGQVSPAYIPSVTRQHLRARFGTAAQVIGFR